MPTDTDSGMLPEGGFSATEQMLAAGAVPAPAQPKSTSRRKWVVPVLKIAAVLLFLYLAYLVLDWLGIINQVKSGFFLMMST